jgi:hypothetical protein
MPYQLVERVKNNTDIVISTIEQFNEYLIGGRSLEDQGERIRLAGLDAGLSDTVCNEIKDWTMSIYDSPNYILSDFDESDQSATRTVVYPSEEFYNNIMLIRSHLSANGYESTTWTFISAGSI